MSELNWFGLPPHPTDDLIHWSEKEPQVLAEKLRAAWDAIHAAGMASQLKLLLETAQLAERLEAAEDEAGASL